MANAERIVGGTGHRPPKLGGYSAAAFEKLVYVLKMYFDSDPPDKVITGMALGFDQALCKAAHECGIYIIAAVPFEGQEDKWPPISRIAYKHLLTLCNEVVIVSKGGYSGTKMDKRNRWIVDHCTEMVTMYNGDLEGGTYNCIEYAKDRMKPIVNLYDIWLKEAA